ncbi:Lysine-specific demethylase 2B [Halotydeus destructor]|nr:Lysine-specific demethylase 2B [Halotydeus destructor]
MIEARLDKIRVWRLCDYRCKQSVDGRLSIASSFYINKAKHFINMDEPIANSVLLPSPVLLSTENRPKSPIKSLGKLDVAGSQEASDVTIEKTGDKTDPSLATLKQPSSCTKPGSVKNNDSSRRRRTRCKKCDACVRADCSECHFCKDMKKFGGPGRMKQSCIARQCMCPVLPHTACCIICGRDGWEKMVATVIVDGENLSSLMECSNCWEILHPVCFKEKNPELSLGLAKKDDLPNSWECPKCVSTGKSGPQKHARPPKQANSVSPVASIIVPSVKRENVMLSTQAVKKLKIPDIPLMHSDKQNGAKNSFIKASARFPLLQEAINQEKKLAAANASLLGQSKPKKNSETLKDRLFRSLKSLKKNSERPANSHSPNFGFLKKQKPLSLKFSDSSSCSSNSALNSPTASLSGLFGMNRQTPTTGIIDSKAKLPVEYDDDTDEQDTDNEISGICEKSIDDKKADLLKPKAVRELIQPMYVIRPAPLPEDVSESEEDEDEPDREDDSEEESEKSLRITKMLRKIRLKRKSNLSLERDAILPVLQHVTRKDLKSCMLVCRLWSAWSIDPTLWEVLDLSGKRINSTILIGIVKRQPLHLDLGWTNINKRQLSWLIARVPRLQSLSLSGCSATATGAINSCNCPLLRKLDLSWVESLNDELIRELSSSPNDSRPGLNDSKTRLRLLSEINLSNTDITDTSLRLISHHLPQLTNINLSGCQRVTDMGIAILGTARSAKLTQLNVSSCSNISDTSLDSLKRCHNLTLIDLRNCSQVSPAACQKFVNCNFFKNKFVLKQTKLIQTKA